MKMTLGGGDQMWGFIGTGPMVDRNWHHIAGTYDQSCENVSGW